MIRNAKIAYSRLANFRVTEPIIFGGRIRGSRVGFLYKYLYISLI